MEELRVTLLVMSIGAVALWVVFAVRLGHLWIISVAPIIWLANEAAFWFARVFFVDSIPSQMLNNWSVVCHITGIMLLVGFGVIFWRSPLLIAPQTPEDVS